MTILLKDLRDAVAQYLDTVLVEVSSPAPSSGTLINANETFTFNVTATNSGAGKPVALKNVRYHVKIDNPAVAKLVVPATNPDAGGIRYKNGAGGFLTMDLAPNAVVSEMYLYPPASGPFTDKAGSLGAGDSDTITGLKGKAGSTQGGGSAKIVCRIIAEPDLDFLFPSSEDCPPKSKTLIVSPT